MVRRFGLRGRMALSFLATSILVVLLVASAYAVLSWTANDDSALMARRVHATAASFAGRLATEPGAVLSADRPFLLGQPGMRPYANFELPSLDNQQMVVPAVTGSRPLGGPVTAAAVVDRGGVVVGTSYPARYPVSGRLAALLPEAAPGFARAIGDGRPVDGAARQDGGVLRWTLHPVRAASGVAGAVLVQAPIPPPVYPFGPVGAVSIAFAALALGLGVALSPVGAIFGVLTMQGTVRRLRLLVDASRALAAGDFSRRVTPGGSDEVAELQRQFNTMAEHLDQAVQARQRLSVEKARLEERGRIARDLHDSISQDLFSLRMRLAGLRQRHAADQDLHVQLGGMSATAGHMITHMRALLLELRPPETDGLDLETGIHELSLAYGSRLGITTDVRTESVELDQAAQEALLRVAQEALSNAARHSGADHVRIGLQVRDGTVELRVADNGRGFATEAPRHGLGLRLVAERVRELGGALELRSSAAGGTDLRVVIPAGRS
jgi:signal transduction histidine kinase